MKMRKFIAEFPGFTPAQTAELRATTDPEEKDNLIAKFVDEYKAARKSAATK